jgi:OFA family oxalate/formate antiporter-like MFS transporter
MSVFTTRWSQLLLGIVCMVMIANLQYGWTLFVLPIDQAHHWGRAAIQVAFTIFVVTETWLVPFEGWVIDRIGPRPTVMAGGALIGASWLLNGYADSLTLLYVSAALGGIGAGAIYGAVVGNAVKWFPERRGLAAGLTAAGFGAGSAITIVPISAWIAASGYQSAFIFFGAVQGVVVMLVALLLVRPPTLPAAEIIVTERDFTPAQVLRHPVFWLMYVMFVMVGAGGLMATAQLAVIASDYGVAKTPVSLLDLTMPALTFALSLDRVLNGVTRPFFGWVSDRIGRELTMLMAFGMEAVGIWMLMTMATSPVAFVIVSGLVFFAWGEIYSLFPATCTDAFGRRHATTNYGMLYTAKGTAALLVPLSSVLATATGSWHAVFIVASVMNATAALMAWFVLKPMRRAQMNKT